MKHLLENWKNHLFELKPKSQGLLPLDVVDFLIKHYAKNPNGQITLKRGYVDKDIFNDKELANTPTYYIAPKHFLIINKDMAQGEFAGVVENILHEIYHYNQNMKWNEDDKFRMEWTKGKKLPPGYTPDDLYDLDFTKLISFWIKAYGYDNAPHEVEAKKFGEKHVREAIKMILDREKELKNVKDPGKMEV